MCRVFRPTSFCLITFVGIYVILTLGFFIIYYGGNSGFPKKGNVDGLLSTFKEEIMFLPVLTWNKTAYITKSSNSDIYFSFNTARSDRLSIIRDIPDTRYYKCALLSYNINSFPKVSVIISFFNEARSTLLRTIVSILLRTPKILLEEIILVDDNSMDKEDGQVLADLPKVKVFRNKKREGLIRSRLSAVKEAKGSLLMFLDSHCEVNLNWLEPLINHIIKNPKSIACPIVDPISPDTFQYDKTTDYIKGGFDWSLEFKWLDTPMKSRITDRISPIISATTTGGVFLIEKDWFNTLGGFDPGLEIWGAESLEISLKTWMCNGSLAIIPCSRVGHVFAKKHPYSFPLGSTYTILRNYKRVAEVWLNHYKRYFYDERPAAVDIDTGSLAMRIALRQSLYCKPFSWYIENIFRELKIPHEGKVAFGQLKQDELCIQSDKKSAQLSLVKCGEEDFPLQTWTYSIITKEIQNKQQYCLTHDNHTLILMQCVGSNYQKWLRSARTIKTIDKLYCIESRQTLQETSILLFPCRFGAITQSWDFSYEIAQQEDLSILDIPTVL